MTGYTSISNALVAVGAKPFATTMQALRDNPLAIAECDSLAPVNASAWHPYNKVTVGDANTGEIWSTATNGAVATITTPGFADGWEYALLIGGIINITVGSPNLLLNCYRATTGAYAGATSLGNTTSDAFPYFAWLEFYMPRRTRRQHTVIGYGQTTASGANNVTATAARLVQTVNHASAEKLLRAQLSLSTGSNIGGTGAAVYLYRRRDIA